MSSGYFEYSPAPWRSLLWKDWMLVRPGIILFVSLGFTFQVILLLWSVLSSDVIGGLWVFSLIMPWLCAVACAAMTFGQERETGSWNWSSSLPQSHTAALSSRLVVSAASIFACFVLLTILPLVFSPIHGAPAINPLLLAGCISILLLASMFFTIATSCALIRTAIYAVVAGVATWFACLYVATVLYRPADSSVVVFSALFCAATFIALALAHRWRWRSGQFSSWPFLGQAGRSMISDWAGHSLIYDQHPSELKMLMRLAVRGSLGWQLVAIVAGAVSLASLPSFDLAAYSSFVQMISVFTLTSLGALALSTHKIRNYYQFLTDRGVQPRKLFAISFGISFLLASLFSTIVAWLYPSTFQYSPLMWICLSIIGFATGAIASVGFRNPSVAWVISLALVFCLYANVLMGGLASTFELRWIPENAAIWFAVFCTIALVFAYFSFQRWTVTGESRSRVLWFTMAMFPVALLASASLSYLFIPKRPWPGGSLAIYAAEPHFDMQLYRDVQTALESPTVVEACEFAESSSTTGSDPQAKAPNIAESLHGSITKLLSTWDDFDTVQRITMNGEITEKLADIAVAVQAKDVAESVKIWKLVKRVRITEDPWNLNLSRDLYALAKLEYSIHGILVPVDDSTADADTAEVSNAFEDAQFVDAQVDGDDAEYGYKGIGGMGTMYGDSEFIEQQVHWVYQPGSEIPVDEIRNLIDLEEPQGVADAAKQMQRATLTYHLELAKDPIGPTSLQTGRQNKELTERATRLGAKWRNWPFITAFPPVAWRVERELARDFKLEPANDVVRYRDLLQSISLMSRQ